MARIRVHLRLSAVPSAGSENRRCTLIHADTAIHPVSPWLFQAVFLASWRLRDLAASREIPKLFLAKPQRSPRVGLVVPVFPSIPLRTVKHSRPSPLAPCPFVPSSRFFRRKWASTCGRIRSRFPNIRRFARNFDHAPSLAPSASSGLLGGPPRADRPQAHGPAPAALNSRLPASDTVFRHPTSNIQHPTSDIQHSTFNIQHSTFNIQHSTFDIRHSKPP